MSKGLTSARLNRKSRFSVLGILSLLLFGLLTVDFCPNLLAQAKTPEALAEAKRRQIERQRRLERKRQQLANPERDVSPQLRRIPEPRPEDRPKLLAQAFEASQSILFESESMLESLRHWELGTLSKKEVKNNVKDSNRRLKKQVKLLRENRLLQWIDWFPGTRSFPKEPLPDGNPSALAAVLGTSCQRYHERISNLRDAGATTIVLDDLKDPGLIESAKRLKELGTKISRQIRDL